MATDVKRRGEVDMTQGSIASKLVRFSLPLMATSILQLLYNAADTMVVGRFAGADALAAVGSTGALINLFIFLFTGFSLGGNVVIAQANGEKDPDKISRAVHTTVALALVSGVVALILGVMLTRPLLIATGVPEEVLDGAQLYMTLVLLGSPANMLYNFGSSILRAMGDTRRPLIYLSISGAVNVLLNLVLVILCKMGVAGVAIATVASQVLSAIFVVVYLMRAEGSIHLNLRKLRLEKEFVAPIIRIGLPSGIQSSMFSISNTLLQGAVNSQGAVVMAGHAAANSLCGFTQVTMSAFATAIITFVSTNRGARLYQRVRRGMWTAMGIGMCISVPVGMAFLCVGESLLGLYNSDPEVIKWGMVNLGIQLPTYFLCGTMEISSAQMRGLRYSFSSMIVNILGICGFRIFWIYTVFAKNPTMRTLYMAYPVSWILTTLAFLAIYFAAALPRLRKEEQEMRNVGI